MSGIAATLLVLLVSGGAYYLGTQNRKPNDQQTSPSTISPISSPSPTPTTKPQPTEIEEKTSIPSGWSTYTNEEYGFEISYPENYQTLDDENNLYGWSNGIVLFYGGGQSYDLPVEVWNTVSEYENKYGAQMNNLTIKKVGNKYITLLNANGKEEVDQIVVTFKIIQ